MCHAHKLWPLLGHTSSFLWWWTAVWCGIIMKLVNFIVSLYSCLLIGAVPSQKSKAKDWSTHHLDAALHHYDTLHVDNISHISSADAQHVVRFNALGREFHLILEWDSNLFTNDFSVQSVDAEGNHHLHDIRQESFLHGHLNSRKKDSLVTAHLSEEGVLSAVIATPTDTYHVEPSQHYIIQPHPFHMVAYAQSHVRQRLNATHFDYATPPVLQGMFSKHRAPPVSKGVESMRRLKRQSMDVGSAGEITANSCNMLLIADTSAFRMFGSNVISTSSQLVLLVSSLDKAIYRPTRWLVDVNDNYITNRGHSIQRILVREEPSNDPEDYNFDRPGLEAGAVLGLMRFGDFSEFCLAHLFTDRQFPNGLLGLANIASPSPDQTGGICSESFRDFGFNPPRPIIFNTGLSTYNNAGQRMILSEMMRVTGHELGHNWGSHHDPSTEECNSFIMNEFAQDGSRATHMMFSDCSKRSIGNVLLNKGGCFVNQLCGDFILDAMEECDAGPDGDRCCTSQCRLSDGAVCSDVNSQCCENCMIADPSTECRAAIGIECVMQTFCDGISSNCPSESPPVDEDTPCPGGVCQTVGDNDRPECVPLCLSMGLERCDCEEAEKECEVCCWNSTVQRCVSLNTNLADGSVCEDGVCINGTCTDRVQDTVERFWDIVTNLNTSAFLIFVNENIVGWTLIFSIPFWCLGSCLLHWLVDVPREKALQHFLDNHDNMAKVFGVGRRRRHSGKVEPMEEQKLLANQPENETEDEPEDQPVEEPVDDLPPPLYRI